ncbi:MAG: hypothetical protein GX621_01675 [Pirellulaceae bacterium]|nr:hypothetical protein [Pirellulaceae bacterium]
MTDESRVLRRRIRLLLGFFLVALIASGITAFPIKAELDLLHETVREGSSAASWCPRAAAWISHVHRGVTAMDANYPFMAYGTDWLAFAHVVIGIAFLGPLRDPVKNVWVVQWGMIACVLVVPLALICGEIRGIPLFWRLIDCSFGVFGIVPLAIAWHDIRRLEPSRSLPPDGI